MQDYFQLLGLPRRFDIDDALLEQRYFEAQRTHHPDKQQDPARRLAAMQYSADLNEAYRALRIPLTRAQHLLALEGIAVNTEKDSTPPSIELLAEVMEWREALNEAEDEKAVAALKAKADKEYAANLAALATAFEKGDATQATQLTLRLGYLAKWQGEVQRQHHFLCNKAG